MTTVLDIWFEILISLDYEIKCVPACGKRIKSVYRAAEETIILCTATHGHKWQNVYPIHSQNITTNQWKF